MQSNNNNVCRLCLKSVRIAYIGVINEVMREMLSLLLIKLDLDVSEHPLVCGTCSEVLDEIYLFKSKCLYTEGIISARIGTNLKISLRDILIETDNKRDIHIGEDEAVCRLCLEIPTNGSYIALSETGDGISFIRDTIQIHLPEVDLSIGKKPIICEVCRVQLKNYGSFATNCMAIEETIKLYCELKKISGPVDLARVLQFMKDKAVDLQNSLDKDLIIKQEGDPVTVKVEKVQDAEDYTAENHFVDCGSSLEFYLKNEDIAIKSETDEMREVADGSEPVFESGDSDSSGENIPLTKKSQNRKSASKEEERLHVCPKTEQEPIIHSDSISTINIWTDFATPKISPKGTRETGARKNVPRVKKTAKSGPERSRECRARKRVLRVKKTAKSGAERSRECRARKKARKIALSRHPIADGSSTDIMIDGNLCIMNDEPSQRNAIASGDISSSSSRSRFRGYLHRQDSSQNSHIVQADIHHQESSLLSQHLADNTVHEQCTDYSDNAVIRKRRKIAKTAAEHCRAYRMRKKAEKQHEMGTGASSSILLDDEISHRKSTAKTAAQRSREYRARRKNLKNAIASKSATSEPSISNTSSDIRVVNASTPFIPQIENSDDPVDELVHSPVLRSLLVINNLRTRN